MKFKRVFFMLGMVASSLFLVMALIGTFGASRPGASLSLAPEAAAPLVETDGPVLGLAAAEPAAPELAAAEQRFTAAPLASEDSPSADSQASKLEPVVPPGLVRQPLSELAAQAEGKPAPQKAAQPPHELALSPARSLPLAVEFGRDARLAGAAFGAAGQSGALDAPLPVGVDLALCLDTQRVWGILGAYETITITVNGVQMGAALADANGFFWTTLYDASGNRPNLSAGDAVQIFHNGVSAASLTVKDLQAQIDAHSEVVSGALSGVSAPTAITLYAPQLEPTPTAYSMTTTTDASGNFSADMSSVWNFSIWDGGAAAYVSGGVEVHTHMFAQPGLMARPSPWNWVFGTAAPGELVTVTVYLSDTITVKDQASANADGNHFFFIALGAEILPSDVVVVEYDSGGAKNLVIEPLSIAMDAASDTISGYAPPGRAVRAELSSGLTPDGYKTFQVAGVADGLTGAYTLDFSGLVNILPDTTASVFLEDAEGDEQNVRTFAPSLVVNQTWDEVFGHADTPPGPAGAGLAVTVTVNSPASGLQSFSGQTSNYGSYYFNPDNGLPDLAPGDVITVVVQGSAWSESITLADLAADDDVASDLISGVYSAPADRVEIDSQQWAVFSDAANQYPVGGYFSAWTSGSAGGFAASTPGYDLRDGSGFTTLHRKADEMGETVYGEADYVRLWPQYNGAVVLFGPPGTAYTLTLRNSLGDFKAEVSNISNPPIGHGGFANFNDSGQRIEPGDSLQARSSAGYNQTFIIPDLAVTVDGDTDRIYGHAPANSLVWLEIAGQGAGYAPTSPSGEFNVLASQLQLVSGSGDVQWGDWGRLCYLYPSGSQACVYYDWPTINAWYDMNGNSQVSGWGAIPGNTIRITVTHPVSGDLAVVETTGGACGWCSPYDYWVELDPGVVAPGNTVSVDFGSGYKASIVVAALTANADINTDLLTGTAPPDSLIYLNVDDGRGGGVNVGQVQVDGSGNYSVDLAAYGWNIQPGDNFNLNYPVQGGHSTNYYYYLPAPSLWMEKWSTPGNAEPGGTYLYQLRYHNDGNGAAENVTLVDVLPPGLSYYAHTGGFPVAVNGNRITLTLGTLPAWSWGDLFLAVYVDPGLTPGIRLGDNCVTIHTTSAGDFDPGNDTACTTSATVENGDAGVWLRKYPVPGDPTPGGQFDYIIEYGSNGSSPAAPFWLTDTLPAGVTLLSWREEWGWGGLWELVSNSGGVVVFRAAAGIPGNMGGRLRLTVALDPATELFSALKNHVIAVAPNDDYPWDNESSEWARARLPRYDLRLDYLDSGGSLTPGGFIDYWMGIYNAGNSAADARITVTLPTGVSYQPGSTWLNDETGGYNLEPVSVSGSQVVWVYPSLGVNRSFNLSFRTDIDSGLASGATLETCAQVAPPYTEGTPGDNARCHTWQVNSPGPNLYIAKSTPRGDNDAWRIYYELRFYNLGNQTIQNVWITDTLPAGTVYGGWHNFNFDWSRLISRTETANLLRWQFSELRPGESGSLQFEANVNDPNDRPRTYTNQAEITTPPGDTNPSDNRAQISTHRGEVYDVRMYVGQDWLNIWGNAVPGYNVLLVTASGTYTTYADPGCNGCWNFNQAGAIWPGDRITLTAGAGLDPLVIDVPAPLSVTADPAADAITGQVGSAAGERLHVWVNNYAWLDALTTPGGFFELRYPDLPENARGEMHYYKQVDGSQVGFFTRYYTAVPQFSANISHEWVQGRYAVGHTAWITVTASDGVTPKATAAVPTYHIPWWGGEPGFEPQSSDWLPSHPDIQAGDWVKVRIDDGPETVMHLGDIQGVVSAADDRIEGTALAPWITPPALLTCHTWGSPNNAPQKWDVISLDGADAFACAWDATREWDILPTQEIGVEYVQPDDNTVFAAFAEPAPYLVINHNPQGAPGEGGNLNLRLNYVNQGGLAAPGVVITQTLKGMNYLYDTSPFPHTTGVTPGGDPYIAWQLGELAPGPWSFFDVFVELNAPASNNITSTVQIDSDAAYDAGSPGEKTHTWSGTVATNNTSVAIQKWPWTNDPVAGGDLIWVVQPCNNGGTSSSEVVLTDLFPANTYFQGWWAQSPGWQEVSNDGSALVLSLGSLANGQCTQVYMRFSLHPGFDPGTSIPNRAWIQVDNDLHPEDNDTSSWVTVGLPHINLYLNKDLPNGQLTPGGVFNYTLSYGNNGNLDAANVVITDTLPEHTYLREIRHYDYNNSYLGEVTNYTQVGRQVSWPVGVLENGFWGSYQVELGVDSGVAPGTVLTNTAEITRIPGEDNLTDNLGSWSVVVQAHGPNLRVYKWRTWNDVSGYAYQIQFNNLGDQPVQNVWITDVVPANTVFNGWTDMGFDVNRLVSSDLQPKQLRWQFSELYPGDSGWLAYNVRLNGPDTRPLGYTNTVSITTVPADTNPADNRYRDVVWRAVVDTAEVWVAGDYAYLWGNAPAGVTVYVATPHGSGSAYADPACGGCWNTGNLGAILPGDPITITSSTSVEPLILRVPNPFYAQADSDANTISGQSGSASSQIILNVYGGSSEYRLNSNPDGTFTASLLDIPKNSSGEMRYDTVVGGATVRFHRRWYTQYPQVSVNYSHEWVNGHWEAGRTVWITVTNSTGVEKAHAQLTTRFVANWGGDQGWEDNSVDWQWQPSRPDFEAGDWVHVRTDSGAQDSLQLGNIQGTVVAAQDRIQGTVSAPWIGQRVQLYCHPWGAPAGGPTRSTWVMPDGVESYQCAWNPSTEWDVLPGQEIGVEYYEPGGNTVMAAFSEAAPHLRITKSSDNNPGEGGGVQFYIDYRNDGNTVALAPVITDTLQGLSFLYDAGGNYTNRTTGVTPGGDPYVRYELPDLAPGESHRLILFAEVLGTQGTTIYNTAQISTASPYDAGDPSEKISTWSAVVDVNDSRLSVSKGAWMGDPYPGEIFIWQTTVCNNGSTASDMLILTDTLPVSATLNSYDTQDTGWEVVSQSGSEVVLRRGSIRNNWCTSIAWNMTLQPSVQIGQGISNTVTISADSDITTGDDIATAWVTAGSARTNLGTSKWWAGGSLTPGGEIRYHMAAQNRGNQTAHSVVLTDTLPVSTTLIHLKKFDYWWRDLGFVTPTVVDGRTIRWEVGTLQPGVTYHYEVMLSIDADAQPGTQMINTVDITRLPGEESYEDNQYTWAEVLYPHGPNLRLRRGGGWDDWGTGTRRASLWTSIENVGDQPVGSFTLVDEYPPEMQWDGTDAEWWRVASFTDNPTTHVYTATFQYLNPGEGTWINHGILYPTAPMPFGMVLTDTAHLIPVLGDTNPADDSAVIVLTTGPDLYVAKSLDSGLLQPGETLTFRLDVGNDLPGNQWWWNTSGNVWVTDTLPVGLEFVGALRQNCGWCPVLPSNIIGQSYGFNLGPFGSGATDALLITVRVSESVGDGALLTNVAEISSDQPGVDIEPYTGNNHSELDLSFSLPALSIGKLYDSTRLAGSVVTYTLSVTNSGSAPATNLVISDTLPAGLTYGSGGGGGGAAFDGTTVTWTIAEILPGAHATLWFSATLPSGGTVVNDDYRVVSSDQGVTSPAGAPVSFDVISFATLSFQAGWNMITLPIVPQTAFNAETVLQDINSQGGACSIIYRIYNGTWQGHTLGSPLYRYPIDMGGGYLLKCSAPSSWTVYGAQLSSSVPLTLAAGWNSIGAPYPPNTYNAETLLVDINSQGGSCNAIYRWYNGNWQGHSLGSPLYRYAIDPDEGYLLRCSAPSSYTPTAFGGLPAYAWRAAAPLDLGMAAMGMFLPGLLAIVRLAAKKQ